MYLVVGLGNPGSKYELTRHNTGFISIDKFCDKHGITCNKEDFFSVYGTGMVAGEKVIVIKPQTYMNESGKAVRAVMDYKKIDIENVIVVYDDLDIDNGKLRIRPKGSAGHHNGMKSIIEHLGSDKFTRIRVGIGKNPYDIVDYVLGKFSKEEFETLAVDKAADAIKTIITDGVEKAQSLFNTK